MPLVQLSMMRTHGRRLRALEIIYLLVRSSFHLLARWDLCMKLQRSVGYCEFAVIWCMSGISRIAIGCGLDEARMIHRGSAAPGAHGDMISTMNSTYIFGVRVIASSLLTS